MPKKLATEHDLFDASRQTAALSTWHVAALSFAGCSVSVFSGVGPLLAAPLLVTVIWALARLHRHAPTARSTGGLIESTLGVRAARTAAGLQWVAYALLSVAATRTVGLAALTARPDLVQDAAQWWWTASSVTAVVVAGALVSWLSTRMVAKVVAALAAAGLLVYLYTSLAVLAKVLSGTPPVDTGATFSPELAGGTTIVFLALAAVGFELPTTAADRIRSIAPPLGWALGAAGVFAALAVVATNLGAVGGSRLNSPDLALIASQMFGDFAVHILIAGGAALWAAALLALTWAVLRMAHRLTGEPTVTTIATVALLAILTVAMCRDWGAISDKSAHVAGMLLVVLYVFVAEANSRLPGAEAAAMAVRVLLPVTLAVVVLLPLRYADFSAQALWPVGITAAIVGIAAAVNAGAVRRRPRAPQLR